MPTGTERTSESPVLSHGRLTFSSIPQIRRSPIGQVIVLSGSLGAHLVTASEPAELLGLLGSLFTQGYTHYDVIDQTERSAERSETKRMTLDPRYSFLLKTTMTARVVDPAEYLSRCNRGASIFDAFYSELIDDISAALADSGPENIRSVQHQVAAYSAELKRRQPIQKGVLVQQFAVTVEYGKDLLRRFETLDKLVIHDKYGDRFFAMEGLIDPDRAARNDEIVKKMRDIRQHDQNYKYEEYDRNLEALRKTQEVTSEDMSKLIQRMRLYDSFGRLIDAPGSPAAAQLAALGETLNPAKGLLSDQKAPKGRGDAPKDKS